MAEDHRDALNDPNHGDGPAASQIDLNPSPPEAPPLDKALRTPGFKGRVKALASWWEQTRPARALSRYSNVNGSLLSSGMALTTMLSLTAVLTVAITVFMAVLGGDDRLRDSFMDSLNAALPGVLRTSSNPQGLVSPDSLVQSNSSSVAGIVALLIAAWSAISLIGSLTSSIQSMFGLVGLPGNVVLKYARYAVGVVGLGIGLLVTAGLGILMNVFGSWLNRALGISPGAGRVALFMSSQAVSVVIDGAVVVLLIRFVAKVRPPRRDLLWGLAMFAVASAVLRQLGTRAVGSVRGPLLTSATAVLTLILWINLVMRVLLLVCAWMANPPRPVPVTTPDEVHFRDSPNFVTLSSPDTLDWPHQAVTGQVQPIPQQETPEDP